MWRDVVRDLRDQPVINRVATTLARGVGMRGEFFMSHLPRRGYVSVTMPEGGKIRLWSDADDWSTSRIWWNGYRAVESETVDLWRRLARRSRTVLDVGAYVGWYALLAAHAGAARVFAFEPHPRIAARCGLNVSLNPWPVVTVPYAATDATRPVDFYVGAPGLPSSSGIDGLAGNYEKIRVAGIRIDDFCRQWDVADVDLVKIDVEGHEPAVLAGMATVLERDRPALVFEMIAQATTGPAIAEALGRFGYRYYQLTDAGPVERASPVAPGDRYSNYLAVRGDRRTPW